VHPEVSRRRCLSWLAAIPVAASVALFATAPALAGPTNVFTLSGAISGTLAVTSTVCGASASAADVQFSWYGNVTTLTGVSTKSIVSIEVDLAGSAYGKHGKLHAKSFHKPPFVTFGATNANALKTPSDWRSVSGKYSTSAGGSNGSIDVTLKRTTTAKPTGHLVLKGSWSACPVAPGT
jgi:hypothetical protein